MIERISRRRILTALGASGLLRAGQIRPGLILHNANIHTMDPAAPRAEAVAIAGDRLLAVGSNDDVLNLATVQTRKIDLGGKTVVPGFIDAHTHVAYSGIR